MGDGDYGSDPNILDTDSDAEEYIALAGTRGFEAPAGITADRITIDGRSEEHTSELQSLMRISYAVFCLKKKKHSLHRPRSHYINQSKDHETHHTTTIAQCDIANI